MMVYRVMRCVMGGRTLSEIRWAGKTVSRYGYITSRIGTNVSQ